LTSSDTRATAVPEVQRSESKDACNNAIMHTVEITDLARGCQSLGTGGHARGDGSTMNEHPAMFDIHSRVLRHHKRRTETGGRV